MLSEKSITVIVPCRNELNYIGDFIENILGQELNNIVLECIIADGSSDDGTRELLDLLSFRHQQIHIIDNPGLIVSSGLNRAISVARGNIIIRMDVHTKYADNYIHECVSALESTNAWCVGGPWVAGGATPAQCAIAAAFQSQIGSGGAASRKINHSGWVDTVYLGAWYRSTLVNLGGFDETLVRNQDDELCLRIHRYGGRIWQSGSIRSIYRPRASLRKLFQQFSQYGYWKIPVIYKHNLPASLRHLAPFIFLMLMLALAVGAFFLRSIGIAFSTILLTYVGAISLGTRKQRLNINKGAMGWLTIAAVVTMHFGYAVGFGRGILDFLVLRRGQRKAMAKLTR